MFNFISPRSSQLLEAAAGRFVLSENLTKVLVTALLSMVPTFEGRYAITIMLGMNMPWYIAYPLAVICSTLPMPFILLLLRKVLDWFYTLPIAPVRKFAAWLEVRSERKRKKMLQKKRGKLSQDAAELLALYIFVALPLPGTGCWTGSAIAALFEMPKKKAAIAILLGNITACAITMFVTLSAKAVI